MEDAEPAAAGAEHRVGLLKLVYALEGLLELVEVRRALDPRALGLLRHLLEARQELVQRRVEQADRDRQPAISSNSPSKSCLLERQQLRERGAAVLLGRRP